MQVFSVRKGVRADLFESQGGTFSPQFHVTGSCDPVEISLVQRLIDKYGDNIAAFHAYEPFPGTFSVELQFKDDAIWLECRKEYHDSFTDDGEIKEEVATTLNGLGRGAKHKQKRVRPAARTLQGKHSKGWQPKKTKKGRKARKKK